MEFGGNEVEDIGMPMPVNYDSIRESSSKLQVLSSVSNGAAGASEEISAKKAFVYRECLKNHAASLGGHAVDGCAEFMPSGDEGTLEALKCAACFCHRNFHRREVEGEPCCLFCNRKRGAFVPLGSPPLALPLPGHMSFVSSEEHLNAAAAAVAGSSAAAAAAAAKKRFRTKFTNEQKDKMLVFAEKLGWRIQKQDEAAVQHFCHDSGVKRHVLKVWMHNNKHTLGKKT